MAERAHRSRVLSRRAVIIGGIATTLAVASATRVGAQSAQPDTGAYMRAIQMEMAGKLRDALPLYRTSLTGADPLSAFLGLERVLHELGWLDSLIVPTERMIASYPRETLYRVAQLRTFRMLSRSADLSAAFERWTRDVPESVEPYRAYAALLIQMGQRPTADSVLRLARRSLGSLNGLEMEEAQVRASTGEWVESAHAWRKALVTAPHLETAAAFSLGPTPQERRDEIRQILLSQPLDIGARRALASLEISWGSMSAAWAALKDLPADTAAATAWTELAERAAADERWPIARDAWIAALGVERTPQRALQAATASLRSGDAAGALRLAPLGEAGKDSSRIATTHVPLHARALTQLGRPEDAEALVKSFERWLAPGPRESLTRTIALGWVRRGDLLHARAALAASGPDADSSDTAGWLALFDGDLVSARVLLRGSGTMDGTSELAIALAILGRVAADRSEAVGSAFLALARGDTATAASAFVRAADTHRDAASILLHTGAELRVATRDTTGAIPLWRRIVESYPDSPEAADAGLSWGRTLRARGDLAGARARFEHLILTHPTSALIPQARRELEMIRGGGR